MLPVALAPEETAIEAFADALALAAAAANDAYTAQVFAEYARDHAPSTIAAQEDDFQTYAAFLASIGFDADLAQRYAHGLMRAPIGWAQVTAGLVGAFKEWLLDQGYAVESINRKLATIHTYAQLAAQAGGMAREAQHAVQGVRGLRQRARINVDLARDLTRRPGGKKAAPTIIAPDQVRDLKRNWPATLAGWRNAALFCLLLDHGFRIGEIAILPRRALDLDTNLLTVYRPKTRLTQQHQLSDDTMRALRAYLALATTSAALPLPPDGPLLRSLTDDRRHVRDNWVDRRHWGRIVKEIGAARDLPTLSPHDCRHCWATRAVKSGVGLKELQQAGGWATLEMPSRYYNADAIANIGVTLQD